MTTPEINDLAFLDNDGRFPNWEEVDIWPNNDSSFQEYCDDSLLPEDNGGLRGIIERQIGRDVQNIGLDLAGGESGLALKELIREGFIGKALLTTYLDRRDEETKKSQLIEHIAGDLVQKETWQKIIEWRKQHCPNGFSLVMHRPVGALQGLWPETYVGLTNVLLDNIRSGGVLFGQVPAAIYGPYMRTMCQSLSDRSDIGSIVTGEDRPFTSAVIIKK